MENQSFTRIASVKQVADNPHYPFSESSLRHLIFDAEQNGLREALCRIGRRVYVDIVAFDKWLISHKSSV